MVTQAGRRFALALTAVFTLLQLGKLLRHVPWRDEMQAWLIARESPSLGHMFHVLRYEGHPGLWYLLLYPLTRLSPSPLLMQLCHLFFVAASLYVLFRHGPFPLREKVLLALGYFLFFEYATISRNYAPEVFLLFLLCTACGAGRRNLFALGVLFLLLAQTQFFAIMVGVALLIALYLDLHLGRHSVPREEVLGFVALLLLTAVLVFVQNEPPLDLGYAMAGTRAYDPRVVRQVGGTFYSSLVPVPALTRDFWNTNLLDPHPWVKLVLAGLLLVLVPLLHARWPALFLLLVSGYGGMLTFSYLKLKGYQRHWGHVFLLLLCATWLSRSGECHRWQPASPLLCRVLDRLDRLRPRFFFGLILIHAVCGLWASAIDLIVPFSASREVARYLKEQHLDRMFIVGDTDFSTMPVAGLLGREFYYPSRHQMGSYILWDRTRFNPLVPAVFDEVLQLVDERAEEALVLFSYPVVEFPPRFTLIRSFQNSTNRTERYNLFRVRRKDP